MGKTQFYQEEMQFLLLDFLKKKYIPTVSSTKAVLVFNQICFIFHPGESDASCLQAGTRVSPLYVDPWDRVDTCIHGTQIHEDCEKCHIELENIVSQCDRYLKQM